MKTENEIVECCATCYFWRGNVETLSKQGLCLHSPPVPVIIRSHLNDGVQLTTMFPTTTHNMFCYRWDNSTCEGGLIK